MGYAVIAKPLSEVQNVNIMMQIEETTDLMCPEDFP